MKNDKPVAIFDLDGTLYKTECVSLKAVHSAISDMKLEPKEDEKVKSLFGFTTPELCGNLFPTLDQKTLSELSDKVRSYERSLIAMHGELYQGIAQLLKDLISEGWLLAICTNGSQVYVKTVLDGMNLNEYFEYVCFRDGQNTKTDHIRQLTNNISNLCVMVGDKAGDIDAARTNSIPSIGVTWGYGTKEEIGHATFIARRVEELKGILSRCKIYHEINAELISLSIIEKKVRIAGINGVDTSGKTHFAKELKSFLHSLGIQALCIHLDDFHNDSATRKRGTTEIDAYIENAFNLVQEESLCR